MNPLKTVCGGWQGCFVKNKKRKRHRICFRQNRSTKYSPTRCARHARWCGNRRLKSPRLKFRKICQKWRYQIRQRSWKTVASQKHRTPCPGTVMTWLLEVLFCTSHTTLRMTSVWIVKVRILNTFGKFQRPGATGAARTKRRRRKKGGFFGNETNSLLRALKQCLNQGDDPEMQQLAKLLSAALLPKTDGRLTEQTHKSAEA